VGSLKEEKGVQKPGGPYPGNVWAIIKHTTDGGKTWKTQFKEVVSKDLFDEALFAVYFINRNVGWVAGDPEGIILYTKDGGKHWKHQKSEITERPLSLRGISFIDAKTGFIIGTRGPETWTGVILYTEDGGKHWKIQREVEGVWFKSIFFTDKKSGWVTGETEYGGIPWLFHTNDGGKTWLERGVEYIGDSYLAFLDRERGVISSDKGFILITKDGGKRWTKKRTPIHKYPWHISEIFKGKGK
jgi:photosystem II stability/assembly factor-like uncharacterized protein